MNYCPLLSERTGFPFTFTFRKHFTNKTWVTSASASCCSIYFCFCCSISIAPINLLFDKSKREHKHNFPLCKQTRWRLLSLSPSSSALLPWPWPTHTLAALALQRPQKILNLDTTMVLVELYKVKMWRQLWTPKPSLPKAVAIAGRLKRLKRQSAQKLLEVFELFSFRTKTKIWRKLCRCNRSLKSVST